MTELQLQSYGLDRPESGDDVVVPFTLENLDCRGRFVRLGDTLDTILTRHDYPPPVARLLGDALLLVVADAEPRVFWKQQREILESNGIPMKGYVFLGDRPMFFL